MQQMRTAPRTIDVLSLLLAFRDTALFQCVAPREKHEKAICHDAFQSAKAILSYYLEATTLAKLMFAPLGFVPYRREIAKTWVLRVMKCRSEIFSFRRSARCAAL
jgi:hypothetical protein